MKYFFRGAMLLSTGCGLVTRVGDESDQAHDGYTPNRYIQHPNSACTFSSSSPASIHSRVAR